MPDDRTPSLTPEQLTELLDKLDEMMAEAARLREQVTRQLARERAGHRQTISSGRTGRKTRR